MRHVILTSVLILVGLVPGRVEAQNRTVVSLAPTGNEALRSRVETNATQVLTALNVAFREGSEPLLPGSVVTDSGRQDIFALWATAPFFCPETRVDSRLVRRSSDGGWEVRGIRLMSGQEAGHLREEEGVLLFTPSGMVNGLYFGLDRQRYNQILRAGGTVTEYRQRQIILDFVENFRTAYNRKDLRFITDVFSDDALIIVGRVIERRESTLLEQSLEQTTVEYVRRSKREYIDQLGGVFARNEFVQVGFSDIEVFQHPRYADIYGVTLLQNWVSSSYADEGYLFLMVDFKEAQPMIHVRTWQPGQYTTEDQVFGLGDFEIIE